MKVLWVSRVAPDRDAIDALRSLHGASMAIEHRQAPDDLPALVDLVASDPRTAFAYVEIPAILAILAERVGLSFGLLLYRGGVLRAVFHVFEQRLIPVWTRTGEGLDDDPLLLPGDPDDPLPTRWSELGERLLPVPLA